MPQPSEWYTANRQRIFPFADTVQDGLPPAAVLDALLYPVDSVGTVFLSRVSKSEETVEVSDETGIIGSGDLAETTELYGARGHKIGVIVFDLSYLPEEVVLTAGQAAFAAAVVFPQSQKRVRGLILPDGQILRGPIVIAAGDGVQVTTSAASAVGGTIKIDVIGVTAEQSGCQPPLPPVTCLQVVQAAGSNFLVSVVESLITISLRVAATALCPPKQIPTLAGALPAVNDDPCAEPDDPASPPAEPAIEQIFECRTNTVLAVGPGLQLGSFQSGAGDDMVPGLKLSVAGRER